MTSPAPGTPSRRRRLWPWGLAAFFAAVVIGVGVCEAMGWPFLAAPLQRVMAKALDRDVRFAQDAESASTMRFGLLGSVRATAGTIFIGAPTWSKTPHMLLARDASIKFGYLDLWRAYRGEPLTIRSLKAAELDSRLERLPDGRATWQFGRQENEPDTSPIPAKLPVVRELQVGSGQITYDDALMQVDLDARFALRDGTDFATTSPPQAGLSVGAAAVAASGHAGGLPSAASGARGSAASASSAASAPDASASSANGLNLVATGHYRKLPIKAEVRSIGVLPIVADNAKTLALPVIVDAVIGRARITFNGTATDVLNLAQLRGRFGVEGPSLAAVGDPLGVTLPTTGPFKTHGLILKEGLVWNAVVEQATVGQSRLSGAFTFDSGRKTPLLSGRLKGTRLLLADLGPAVGTEVKATAPAKALVPHSSPVKAPAPNPPPPAGRVLPDRPFDLPALRAMDANVLVDIDDLDLGSSILEPLRPLRTHLVLANGVLTLHDIDARTGQGNLGGEVQLDGRMAQALWNAQLHWSGVKLESWIKQKRADNAPPWVTGKLDGQATLAGQGKSTATILGSLHGGIRMYLLNGSVSHLAVEAAGLDVAQALGMLIKGDDSLPILCTVADLVVDQGLVRPRVLVLDTNDSTLWVDGSLSLATEALDLRVVVTPKDFSPLALRSPIRLRGSFANPNVSIDKGPLAERLGAAGLLALLNPLAAIIPLMDIGSSDDAKAGAAKCQALAQRKAGKPPVAPKAAAKVTERIQARGAR